MMITGKYLHRRTFLRGIGAAVALPMLDAMRPAMATAATAAATKPPHAARIYVHSEWRNFESLEARDDRRGL